MDKPESSVCLFSIKVAVNATALFPAWLYQQEVQTKRIPIILVRILVIVTEFLITSIRMFDRFNYIFMIESINISIIMVQSDPFPL